MINVPRLSERIEASGLSYSAIARAVGVRQPTISRLASGEQRTTAHLHRLARVLATTPSYLTGDTDDASADALPPAPTPTAQVATLQVLLPSEEALTRMFLGVLKASPRMSQDELARELAKSLPSGLQLLRGPLIYEEQDLDEHPHEAAEAAPSAERVRRRA